VRDGRIYVRFRDKQMGENGELRKEVRVRGGQKKFTAFCIR
jgi:hypothetical protein